MNEAMVQYLLDNNHLDWLVGMCGIKDVSSVTGKENELLRWARITGECHDLGKKELMSTIEQHFSPIVNLEYHVIRKHIEGRYFDPDDFGRDKDLAECINYVATKHHEAFLGQGRRGYPDVGHGDEENLPYARLRDITQICDVMNAVISRSSYTEKRVMENALHVIETGKEDFGGTTEFNPQLVDMILNSKPLQDKLNWCSTEYYREQEYAGYQRYVHEIYE
jgi:HD-GYP domain-containing protein (c-di-GMP phosphodiesterase class II)